MQNESPDNQDGAPEPAPEFMKEFQRAIETYAQAVDADKTEDADRAAFSALLLAAEEAQANPTPEMLLGQEASGYLNACDWARAEASYRKLLHLQEQSGNPALTVKARVELSRLLRLTDRLDEAWIFACSASDSALRSDLYPLLAMALENQAVCALARNDTAAALAAGSEALRVLEPGKIADLMRARMLVLRAQCLVACGDVASAEKDLESSWAILSVRKLPAVGTGPLVALGNWHEVRADIDGTRGALAEAVGALARAIEYRREFFNLALESSPHAHAALARVLGKFADLLQKAGDEASAAGASAEAEKIWRNLNLPER